MNLTRIVAGELAELLGIDPLKERKGVKLGLLLRPVVPEDPPVVHEALGRASHFGGDISFSCRIGRTARSAALR